MNSLAWIIDGEVLIQRPPTTSTPGQLLAHWPAPSLDPGELATSLASHGWQPDGEWNHHDGGLVITVRPTT